MYNSGSQQAHIPAPNSNQLCPPGYNGQPNNGYPNCPPGYKQVPVTEQAQSISTNVVVNAGGRSRVERSWTTQLCGCMEDVPDCLCGLFCAPLHMCMLASRMKELFCLPVCIPCSLMAMRTKIRASNRIKGTICKDFFVTSCCAQLAACQLKREMDNIDKRKPGTEL